MSLAVLGGLFKGRAVQVVYSDETDLSDGSEAVVVGVMFNMDSQWFPVIGSIETLLAREGVLTVAN